MAGKYDDLARAILENVGGKENVNSVAHCITRVRFKLKDEGKANTEAIEKLEGVIKVMQANGQYQVVVGNKVEDVYDAVVAVGGLVAGGEIDAEDDAPKHSRQGHRPHLGHLRPHAGHLRRRRHHEGILAAITQFWPAFANDGSYTILYTIADGMFYFLPVILAYTASKKFRMNEFTGMAIGLALVYPTMVALTGGEVVGSIDLGFAGTFSWYATFLGIPIIMPASGYTSSVIPIILMIWFGSTVEHWCKKWMPASVKMFSTPLVTMTASIVLGYLVIGPIATLITNLLSLLFSALFGLPVIGSVLGCTIVGAFWMCLVIFGFHWSPHGPSRVSSTSPRWVMIHSWCRDRPLLLPGRRALCHVSEEQGRELPRHLPARHYLLLLLRRDRARHLRRCPSRQEGLRGCEYRLRVGGLIIGLTGAMVYISGGLGVFNWLSFLPTDPASTVGIMHMVWAIVASLAGAVVGFVIEYATYKPEAAK